MSLQSSMPSPKVLMQLLSSLRLYLSFSLAEALACRLKILRLSLSSSFSRQFLTRPFTFSILSFYYLIISLILVFLLSSMSYVILKSNYCFLSFIDMSNLQSYLFSYLAGVFLLEDFIYCFYSIFVVFFSKF